MSRLTAAIGACVAASAAYVAGGDNATSAAAQTRSRILDRTVSCRVEGVGSPDPARFITASAFPRLGQVPGVTAPLVYAHHGEGEAGFGVGFAVHPTGRAWVNRSKCTEAHVQVPLSSTGLKGGRTRFGENHRCEVPARILIRIRVIFTRSFALRTDPDARYQLVAKGRIVTGSVAVATPQRKLIAFGEADGAAGKASVFTSPARCFPT